MAYIDKITAINSSNNTSEVFDIKDTTSGYTTNTGTVTKVTVGSDLKVGSTAGGNITTTGTITHANSVTAKTTQALYPIRFDAQGHITGSGSAITNISAFTNDVGYVTSEDIPEGASAYTGTISAVSTAASSGTSNGFARGDHTHNITKTTIDSTLGTGSGTTKFYREDGSWATPNYIANTDEKLKIAAVTSGTTYYPVVAANSTAAAARQYDATGLAYAGTNGTTSAVGTAKITLGNSTASGTANNKKGQIILYGSTAYATTIDPGSPTAARTLTLPNKTGTVALTSDIPTKVSELTNDTGYITSYTDTKNTAGSTNTTSKIFLVGATSQAANPQTYSNSKLYYTRSSGLYSEGGNDDNFSVISQSGRKIDLQVSTDNTSHTPKVTIDETGVYVGDTTVSSSTITLNSGLWWSDSDNYVRIKNLIAPTNNLDAANKKYVDDSIPTNVSQLTNDSGYITSADVPEGASAYTGTISAVGTAASSGTNNGFARGDHVHNITKTTIDSVLGTGSGTTKYYREDGTWVAPTDTKNTAGSTNTSSKIFLIGATSQAANPQTYSHDTAYVGTDGKLYSASKVVLVGGSNASSSVTITPTTTDVYSMTSAGSVTAGTKASFTRGTFSQGTLPTMTWAMDSTDTKKLNITFSQGTLPTHAADSFTANTPTAVTLPGRSSAIKAWTGYSAATAAAQTFTGVTA